MKHPPVPVPPVLPFPVSPHPLVSSLSVPHSPHLLLGTAPHSVPHLHPHPHLLHRDPSAHVLVVRPVTAIEASPLLLHRLTAETPAESSLTEFCPSDVPRRGEGTSVWKSRLRRCKDRATVGTETETTEGSGCQQVLGVISDGRRAAPARDTIAVGCLVVEVVVGCHGGVSAGVGAERERVGVVETTAISVLLRPAELVSRRWCRLVYTATFAGSARTLVGTKRARLGGGVK